jgi:hypothetical protein
MLGKKLSQLTTMKVILLVLTMLVVVPQFQLEVSGLVPFKHVVDSGQYGLDRAQAFWIDYVGEKEKLGASPTAAQQAKLADRKREYDLSLLRYVYDHNPNANQPGQPACVISPEKGGYTGCVGNYLSALVWVGYDGQSANLQTSPPHVTAMCAETANWDLDFNRILQDAATRDPELRLSDIDSGVLPEEIKTKLCAPWAEQCSQGGLKTRSLQGITVDGSGAFWKLKQEETTRSDHCALHLLRWNEQSVVEATMMRGDNAKDSLVAVFNQKQYVIYDSIFSIFTTLFVCLVRTSGGEK